MKKIKRIHFVGIKGVGMTPLAIIAKEAGFIVTGSDISEEFITDELLKKAGITAFVGFDEKNVEGVDLVITTGAHGGFDNLENIQAKKLGISIWSQGQAVGKFMDGSIMEKVFDGISVAGSHGKTTTTAMIATILKENKLDPSFLIGTGNIPSLGSSGHYGKGKYFVAEADEYATEPKYDKTPKFLWQHPKTGVITNIEFDHPDLYSSIDQLRHEFLNFSNNISENGILIACIDDLETSRLLNDYKGHFITYGFSKNADFNIDRLSIEQDRMFLWVNARNTSLGEFVLNITGEHNALNALAAIVVCLELGLSIEKIKTGLMKFYGTKRRFEYMGKLLSGALLYDDYAHHPTEIRKTLTAFKKTFPNKKIVCIFQPHTYSRTKSLFEQFIGSFSVADVVLLVDTYTSLREEIDNSVTSKLLADNISRIHKDVIYTPKGEDVIEYLDQKSFGKDYIIITMGAGDIYKISLHLIN
nr:UDP-N-acetylmuramate--L-alanine ligase [Candidatus Levybacteria bacterium]